MNRFIVCFATFFLVFLGVKNAPAETTALSPLYDATADFSNGGALIVDGQSSVNMQNYPAVLVDRRGVMEFNISQIPDIATITSAQLTLEIANLTSAPNIYPTVAIHGYSGNGTHEIADGQVPANLLGESAPIQSLSTITIDLNPAYIQSLLTTTNYLGLLTLGNENHKQAAFVTLEGETNGIGSAPLLMINYVPEPGVFVLLAVAVCSSAVIWRRRR
jgi:hypothetical protein